MSFENEGNWLSLLIAISSEEWYPKEWMIDRMIHPELEKGKCTYSFNRFSPVCIVYGEKRLWQSLVYNHRDLYSTMTTRFQILENEFTLGDRHFWNRFINKLKITKQEVVYMLQKENRANEDFSFFYGLVFNAVYGEGYHELKVFELKVFDTAGREKKSVVVKTEDEARRMYNTLSIAWEGKKMSIVTYEITKKTLPLCCRPVGR